ncbi:MAG TPA: hypothetical protein VNB49_18035 [Candidatus Dormibacteraeota bacterium]|nr:hypothetical protein [Candidatus Dormibacteraeota bacterium]
MLRFCFIDTSKNENLANEKPAVFLLKLWIFALAILLALVSAFTGLHLYGD